MMLRGDRLGVFARAELFKALNDQRHGDRWRGVELKLNGAIEFAAKSIEEIDLRGNFFRG
jgi:hypothetical protein